MSAMMSAPESSVNRNVLINWYLRDRVCHEVCEFYPRKATSGLWAIGDDSVPESVVVDETLSNQLRSLHPQKAFKLAQTVANIIGTAVLVIDDGRELAAPPKGALSLSMLLPEGFASLIPPTDSEVYVMSDNTPVHKSRVLVFYGVENPFDTRGYGASKLHPFLGQYEPYLKAVKRLGKELSDRSIFTIKKTGLEKQLKTTDGISILKKLFLTLRKGLDSLGMLSIDKDTMEADWKERTFAGVDIAFTELRRMVVAASDITEFELFGIYDRSGLGEKGGNDRIIAATKATELQAEWEGNGNLGKLKGAIAPNSNLKVLLDSTLKLNPLELADANLKNAQAELARSQARQIDSGVSALIPSGSDK